MVDLGKSDKMIKNKSKSKPTLTTDLMIFPSLLTEELPQNENEFFVSSAIEEIDKKKD